MFARIEFLKIMDTSEAVKNRGNAAFAEGKIDEALKHYSDALALLAKEVGGEDRLATCPDAAALYSNRSACQLKLRHYNEAVGDARLAVAAKPDWWKASYRLALALEALEEYEDAYEHMGKAHLLDPSNSDVKAKLRVLTGIRAEREKNAARRSTCADVIDSDVGVSKKKAVGADVHRKARSPPLVSPMWRTLIDRQFNRIKKGSRAGKKLTVRPPLIDGRPSSESGPMFFAAVPEWTDKIEEIIAYMSQGKDVPGEMRWLANFAESAWTNQRNADVEHRKRNKIPNRCDYCEIDLSHFGLTAPCCECGEVYCSRQCLELDYKSHKQACKMVREQSDSVSMFLQAYWDMVMYGLLPWVGETVKNYSVQYHKKRADKKITNTVVRPPRNEDDVEVDEFSYLMKFEREETMNSTINFQNLAKNASSDEAAELALTALEAHCLALHIRYAMYLEGYDSPYRAAFKKLMSTMLHDNILRPMQLSNVVESPAVTECRLDVGASKLTDEIGRASVIANWTSLKAIR